MEKETISKETSLIKPSNNEIPVMERLVNSMRSVVELIREVIETKTKVEIIPFS